MPDKDGENLKQKQEQSKLNMQGQAAKQGAKMAANAAFGPLGGKAVDLASKTELGKKVLNNASNMAKPGSMPGMNPKQILGNQKNGYNPFENIKNKADSPSLQVNQGASQDSETSESNSANNMSPLDSLPKIGLPPTDGFGEDKESESKGFNFLNKFKNKKTDEEQDTVSVTVELKKIGKQVSIFMSYLGCIFSFLLVIIIIINLLNMTSPLFYVNQVINNISSTVSSTLGDFLEKVNNIAKCGYMSDEDCEEKLENKFYTKLKESYQNHQSNYHVTVDYTLIASALTWLDDSMENLTEEDINNLLNNNQNPELYNQYIDFNKNKKYIDELAKAQIAQEAYDCSYYDENDELVEQGCLHYVLDLDKFNYYLTDKEDFTNYVNDLKNDCVYGVCPTEQFESILTHSPFIGFLYNVEESNTLRIKNIFEEIYSKKEFYEYIMEQEYGNLAFTKSYAYCSGITVKDTSDNIIGTYDLEKYVAGVIANEAYAGEGVEAYKAQAIAARTYALKLTNNCSSSIKNSEENQTFNENPPDWAIQAANDTAGLVLVHNDEIFLSEYDSFCYGDTRCPDAKQNANGSYSVTYTKLPLNEKHLVTISGDYADRFTGYGHARGMSQLKSYEMAKNGSSYKDILTYFYSDGVQIVSMNMMASGKYSSSTAIPSSTEEVRARSLTYLNMVGVFGNQTKSLSTIYKYNASNLGECVWYARGRALELIYFSTMDPATKLAAYNAIEGAYGNGEAWYRNTTIFEKTTDYTKPKPGAIVSWSGGSTRCSGGCGHVAIIESVDYATQTVVVSDGWASANSSGSRPHTWPYVNVRTRTLTFSQVKNYADGYRFNGYVYILG